MSIPLDTFLKTSAVKECVELYHQELPLYRAAALKIYNDVNNYNRERIYFSSTQCRIKSKNSLLSKIYKNLKVEHERTEEISQDSIREAYKNIKDIVGLRVACQYLSDIVPLANQVFWDFLVKQKGYGAPRKDPRRDSSTFKAKDFTRNPEEVTGYYGFHLYLEVPTEIDIFGMEQRKQICEIQIKTEIQHIWSSRSHNLVYKPQELVSPNIIDKMKVIGTQLHAADWFLNDLRSDLNIFKSIEE